MARRSATDTPTPRPTAAELEILRMLWERGPSTVRDVFTALSAERPVGYTGVLKLMQLMAGKGLVLRDETQAAHIYRAAAAPETTKRQVVGDLMRKVFAGSASQLVLHALQHDQAGAEEIAEIRRMLDAYEAGRATSTVRSPDDGSDS